MNRQIRAFSIISLVALIVGFASCSSFKPIEVGNPTDFKVHSIEGSNIKASIYLPIKNPNFLNVKVHKVNAIAYINNKKTGKVTSSEILKIPGNSDKTQELEFKVDFSDIVSGGFSFLNILREGKVDLKLEGTITAKSLFTEKKIDFAKERSIKLND
jgi:LEA14-like dessication related protein